MSNIHGQTQANIVALPALEVQAIAAALRTVTEPGAGWRDPFARQTAEAALGKVDRTENPQIFVRHDVQIPAEGEILKRRTDSALEAKACALMTQYGFFLPKPAKEFFRELADHLNWQNLKGQL